ncbi:MAG TPA: 2-phospho-L-lactate guanylyltransferase [Nitrosopumilaceae archaeon]|nr:2-phospho-L-lactate guanylyltransferase [Nitrosopumilaceae archaeon]
MKVAAIIPVKTFSKAKTRLSLPPKAKDELCKLMFEEVLRTIVDSDIDKIVVVTKDKDAIEIGKSYDVIQILDDNETGVNNAVSLADKYLAKNGFDASIVFPQDIPFMQREDIDYLLKVSSENSVLVVPSRRFDGTNALLRSPVSIMETHYDEDSYKIHLHTGRTRTRKTSLVLMRRVMMDVDNNEDLQFVLDQNEKPEFCEKLAGLLKSVS